MIRFLLRAFICILVICLPVVLLVSSTGQSENFLYLIFPVVLAVPALILTIAVLVPVEAISDRAGAPWLKDMLVPLIGALAAIAIGIVYVGQVGTFPSLTAEPERLSRFLLSWALFGGLWGLCWRASAWVLRWIGKRANA